MTETDTDLRAYRIVLTTHGILNGLTPALTPTGHDPATDQRLARAVVDWADRTQAGIYQIPAADHLLPGIPGRTPPDSDRQNLDFVFSQLSVYLANGYSWSGVILRSEEVAGARGRLWRRLFLDLAQSRRLRVPPVWSLSARSNPERVLSRRGRSILLSSRPLEVPA